MNRKTLHYENISYVDIHKSYKEVMSLLSEPYYVINHDFINKIGLFVQKGANVKQEYERAVREFYRSDILDVDFGAAGSGEVLNSMNRYKENGHKDTSMHIHHKGKILNSFLLNENLVQASQKMVNRFFGNIR